MIWPFKKTRKKGRASRISISPPTPDADRHGIALVAIAKNEERRIEDWLTFHALAGVREVILYDNMSDDRTAEIARNFKSMPVTVIPWQLHTELRSPALILPRQTLAYCHALATFGHKYRWMGFIDIDEYIIPKDHDKIEDVLAPLETFANISLPWVMFGHNGHEAPTQDPVPFAFTARAEIAPGPLLNFKCIVDPSQVTNVGVHRFETRSMGAQSANTVGKVAHNKKRKSANFPSTAGLQLNHYYLMSKQETEEKLAKGAVSGAELSQRTGKVREKQNLIESDPSQDFCAVEFLRRNGIANAAAFRDNPLHNLQRMRAPQSATMEFPQ